MSIASRCLLLSLLAVTLGACGGVPSSQDPIDGGGEPREGGGDTHDAGSGEPDGGQDLEDGGQPEADAGTSEDAGTPGDAGTPEDAGSEEDAGTPPDAGAKDAGTPCVTTVTYGNAWLHPPNHPADQDVVSGLVTWDGLCHNDGANSYAVLSNGWKPYFAGNGTCVIALDYAGDCGQPSSCATRVSYGTAWLPPPNHPAQYDDVSGRVLWNGTCANAGSNSQATLSNGWTPTFSGNNNCELGLRYTSCGGLYANSTLAASCADPGVTRDGNTWVMACTSGNATHAFRIFTSPDLVSWTARGHIFPSGQKPAWATGDFWAPEIHKVGSGYVAYYSARHTSGRLAIGAATASTALGPFTDLGAPLILDASMGMIDVSYFEDGQGTPYLVWKADGNAVNQPTPIYGRKLTANGLGFVGGRVQLITNDRAWEGNVTEAPFVLRHAGNYFLFYSGNAFYNSTYAIGVAKASSPLGPYTKLGPPIVTTNVDWVGPGHNSVVLAPSGQHALVYHAWVPGQVNVPGAGRKLLVDTITWSGGWPRAYAAPSATSQPMP